MENVQETLENYRNEVITMQNFPLKNETIKKILEGTYDVIDYFDELYDYYFDEMPYGIQKARDGDPDEWIYQRLEAEFGPC